MDNLVQPSGMNIEITTCCPLRCPQCYCTLEGGKHIPLQTAVTVLHEAAEMGIEHVELSGGETLCYPYLYQLIKEARSLNIMPNIAISGWHFNNEVLDNLIEAGVDGIYVSLNAPTKELNDLSRDGYEYAIQALSVLKESGFQNYYINWVMHRHTADTIEEMYEIAKEYYAKALVVLTPKPDATNQLNTFPTRDQLTYTADYIKHNQNGDTKIVVECCFSPLLALIGHNKLWGNLNRGIYKGCGAGRTVLNVNVDGLLSPCRHLDYFEKWDTLEEYWTQSPILQKIRTLEDSKREPCLSCKYCDYCRHCLAVNSKINNDLYIGNSFCPLSESIPNS